MVSELLVINPQELTFEFELMKQSSDLIRLSNNSDQYIAFKVKTTSPKRYCVRPNIGIIQPRSTSVFTVTMQAQQEAFPYMQCKDKFLVQSTIVPFGTKEEDISSDLFAMNGGKYIEEKKLRVVLISPTPKTIPVNGKSENGSVEKMLNQDTHFPCGLHKPLSELIYKDEGPEFSTDIKTSVVKIGEVIKGLSNPKNGETARLSTCKDDNQLLNMVPAAVKETVNINSLQATTENIRAGRKSIQNAESATLKDLWSKPQTVESRPTAKVDIGANESMEFLNNVNAELKIEKRGTDTNSKNNVEMLKSKLNDINMQLTESENTITKLEEENKKSIKEIEMLKQELSLLRQGTNTNAVQVYDGLSLLFVVMVALVSLLSGYLLRP